MCWMCDAMAPKCRSVMLPAWMYGSLEGCPPVKSPSDGYPPLESGKKLHSSTASSEPEDVIEDTRQAPGRLNVIDSTGTSGPKPKNPGSIELSGVFCL